MTFPCPSCAPVVSSSVVHQPILILHAGHDPTTALAAEILRCEGFPWFSEEPLDQFTTAAPGVVLIVVAGTVTQDQAAERLAAAVAAGTPLIALAAGQALARAFGVELGDSLTDAELVIRVPAISDPADADLPGWEHEDQALLCPGDVRTLIARTLANHPPIATFQAPASQAVGDRAMSGQAIGGQARGAAIARAEVGEGHAWLYGYDLCQTIATLRHGSGALDPPDTSGQTWGGPRALYGFWGLAEKLPLTVPVADVHQDVLRCLVSGALSDTPLPRLWHFQAGAPSVFMVRGDGCGEEGADHEVAVMEAHDAFLTFCRPRHSRYSGELMREWHDGGHGISIEANINGITQQTVDDATSPDGRRSLTAAELNTHHLDAIRDNLIDHRDAFREETGLDMVSFMTHSAQWTGLPMVQLAQELGWQMLLPFQSIDPRMPVGTQPGPYVMPTAHPMRYFDHEAGLQDLWHMPYQWIDMIWQTVASQQQAGMTDPMQLAGMLGQDGDEYGALVAHFTTEAARRWHVAQVCSFHPVYVSKAWPYLGSSRSALEMALRAAQREGARFDNLEHWTGFVRGRDAVRIVGCRQEGASTVITLQTELAVQDLTLLLPDSVCEVRGERGDALPLVSRHLEGRDQSTVCIDLPEKIPVELCLIQSD
ncbi:MAG: hypothetical protein HN404_03340 [Gemmatimonadetes bacterium]|nr:hypothetical protein [Gemmatimonadota bacterium]